MENRDIKPTGKEIGKTGPYHLDAKPEDVGTKVVRQTEKQTPSP